MVAKLVTWIARLRGKRSVKVVRKTLVMLFPFALLGSVAQILAQSVFSKYGFLNNIFGLSDRLPYFNKIYYFFTNFSFLTLGIIALIAAYQAAYYQAKYLHRDRLMAGLTGLVSLLLLTVRPLNETGHLNFNWGILGTHGLLVGLLVGYLVGWLFYFFGGQAVEEVEHTDDLLARAFLALPAITLAIILCLAFNLGLSFFKGQEFLTNLIANIEVFADNQDKFWMVILLGGLSNILAWVGLAGPYNTTGTVYADQKYLDNLNYALSHHSAWNVPYKYTATTLYQAFGTFGGVGATLALLIAITLVSHSKRALRVSRWSFLPVFFNVNSPLMIGLPLFFNPLYLVPFVLAPCINMALASLAFSLHMLPVLTYPVPEGTPGVLVAYIGTNAQFGSLLLGILLLGLDVLLYLPFVKLADLVGSKLDGGDVYEA